MADCTSLAGGVASGGRRRRTATRRDASERGQGPAASSGVRELTEAELDALPWTEDMDVYDEQFGIERMQAESDAAEQRRTAAREHAGLPPQARLHPYVPSGMGEYMPQFTLNEAAPDAAEEEASESDSESGSESS